MSAEGLLPPEPRRAALMRLDAAAIAKRFFHLERALTVAYGAWVTRVARLESKASLAKAAWQSSRTATELRNRVLELRFPDTDLDVGADRPLVMLVEALVHAPNGPALLQTLSVDVLPAIAAAYRDYLAASDPIADGPTHRFLPLAAQEKDEQIDSFAAVLAAESPTGPDDEGRAWSAHVRSLLDAAGGASMDAPRSAAIPEIVPPGRAFSIPDIPARDDTYLRSKFYWPDNFDPDFPYGEGIALQLRAAISHLNEVWAVETAGALLFEFSGTLGWDFVVDAARWLYDESRHMLMGMQRLDWWGFERARVPLGEFIYTSCAGRDPIYRLGMLAYFETKNIGRKRERAGEFRLLGDATSEADMDFDWADEAIHAGYGRRWMKRLLEARGDDPGRWRRIVETCDALVRETVAAASEQQRNEIRTAAEALLQEARRRAELAKVPQPPTG